MNVVQVTQNLLARGSFHKRPNKLAELKELGVDTVFCLLRKGDEDLRGLDWLEYVQHPLPDGNTVPVEEASEVADQVIERLNAGRKVLVHCIGGKNRTGIVIALVLMKKFGLLGNEAVALYRGLRGPAGLSNDTYREWLSGLVEPPRKHVGV